MINNQQLIIAQSIRLGIYFSEVNVCGIIFIELNCYMKL
ncbi:MAG: hypothetical protein UR66_C0006G0036 [Candidatus Moranbacteria bacterium GW2011_GWE1_35_17]|nr:MAG: hypothetical protein UR66_C0006G0036 [Candidatus Moranbacteria bacterium GW2011_GWE1_35_17]KKP84907.1 MAG: hypothetical protein UR83_C0008G0021 [Candidatus Moranbacteria bacterium GW2011_GWF2_35_54]